MLAQKLVEEGYEVSVHDPQSIDTAKDILGDSVIYHNDIYSCVKDAGAVVVMTNWPQYHKLDWQKVATLVADDALILDSWRILQTTQLNGQIKYVAIGRS
jgi:UDPglucose 6-dehydrogenase